MQTSSPPSPLPDGGIYGQSEKGCHINGVGAYTPEMQELDEYLITHADKVYVDSYNGAPAEAGTPLFPVERHLFQRKSPEIGELILGKVPGRGSADEITVFNTVGTAALDGNGSQYLP